MTRDLHGDLLRAASALLRDEGPEALTVRRIATAAGSSTMGVYSQFGGKDGVVDALFREGFTLLRDTLRAIERTDDPLADLRQGCGRYWDFATGNATHYRIMFEGAVPGFVPTDASMEIAADSFGQLVELVGRAVDAGLLHGDRTEISASLWATCHGIASLEISGARPSTLEPGLPAAATTDALIRGWQVVPAAAPPG